MLIKNPLGYIGDINIKANLSVINEKEIITMPIPTASENFISFHFPVLWKKTPDRVRIDLELTYDLFYMLTHGEGKIKTRQEWFINYPLKVIQIIPVPLKSLGEKHNGDISCFINVNSSQNVLDVNGPSISMTVGMQVKRVKPSLVEDILDLVPVPGVGGGSREEITSKPLLFDIKAGIAVIGRPEPKPTPTPTPKPKPLEVPGDLLSHVIRFEVEGQKHMSVYGLRRLEDDWYDPIKRYSSKLHQAIRTGNCPVYLTGFASDTGNVKDNLDLSNARLTSVEQTIKTDLFKSKNVKVLLTPHGENKATQTGAVPRERRVDIEIKVKDAAIAVTKK